MPIIPGKCYKITNPVNKNTLYIITGFIPWYYVKSRVKHARKKNIDY